MLYTSLKYWECQRVEFVVDGCRVVTILKLILICTALVIWHERDLTCFGSVLRIVLLILVSLFRYHDVPLCSSYFYMAILSK